MEKQIQFIRKWLAFFMAALVISGLTAVPLEWGLSIASSLVDNAWLGNVYHAIHDTGSKYPFLFYGYDWLAFAHIIIAMAFIGPYRDPVRNKWVIEFGIYACLLIIPFALIAGHFRGIPSWWRLVDCSFGIFGLVPLLLCYKKIQQLDSIETND